MPKDPTLKKVMVIGSGPIVIGQAAEFDYAGTQACQSLREEGLQVVLVNSNPATIMTDPAMADRVYIEPLAPEYVAEVIARERPDGLLPTLGGQVGLNLAVELARQGVLQRHGVRLLGTPLEAIQKAEDRELFKATMAALGEPVPESRIVHKVAEALEFAEATGYPVIVRPAYTLGGTGGGLADNPDDLESVTRRGLKLSPVGQCLIERSVAGFKEVEYEVLRDGRDNAVIVCNMENVDPVGIHTGDSIVVAPSQTLSDKEYQMLRSASLRIIRSLGIQGGCNVQFALDPKSQQYYVIEVNPRVSRSSALASKATGYPIAKVAAKIAIGLGLDEIVNPVTGSTTAGFEPALDYVVVKIPRWPFDKLTTALRSLGTQMKATGEVMAIERTFEAALLKAVRSVELGRMGLWRPGLAAVEEEELTRRLTAADDERLWLVAEALRRGRTVEQVSDQTGIDRYFVERTARIVRMERELRAVAEGGAAGTPSLPAPPGQPAGSKQTSAAPPGPGEPLPSDLLRRAKRLGLADAQIAALTGTTEEDVRAQRLGRGIGSVYKMVDTCAAEFEAATPYYYATYEGEDELAPSTRPRVLVLGSGPIRIGQGIEFDYASVHAVKAIRASGREALIINCNPETVSTDFDTADRLFFDPLALEDVLNVIESEQPQGVICQFGGQTAINLAGSLAERGVTILGTAVEEMDRAEDRRKFDALLEETGVPRPAGGAVTSAPEALEVASRVGYPVLVRPSYVLGGRAMEIVYTPDELVDYMHRAVLVSHDRPVLVDRYLSGVELEVDAVADGQDVLVAGIMQHVERAGVHSGDSIAVYPTPGVSESVRRQVVDHTVTLARALKVRGLLNLQFVAAGEDVYVLEVNPRSSRTVPYLTKVTGLPLVTLATQVILGQSLRELGYSTGLWPEPPYVGVKAPVFSWSKLLQVDTALGPEMKSTGEVMGLGETYAEALYKALLAAGIAPPEGKPVLITVADRDKAEVLEVARGLAAHGHTIFATAGTCRYLLQNGVSAEPVYKLSEGSTEILDLIRGGTVGLVVNTMTRGRAPERDGFQIRRTAVEHGVACLTSLDTAQALLTVMAGEAGREPNGEKAAAGHAFLRVRSLQEYQALAAPLPGGPQP